MFSTLSAELIQFAISVVNLLPQSPFVILDTAEVADVAAWLPYVNWFVPIGTMLTIFSSWLVCVALYYVYQVVLRWVKVIE